MGLKRSATILVLFGICFGYAEAMAVIYVRSIYKPLQQRFAPAAPGDDLYPLPDLNRIRVEAPEAIRLLRYELVREAATILMLGAVALLASRGREQWLPCLAIVFGVWDISFYLFLKLLIGWPASLMTWDLLFLIPVPWSAPVLAPMLVSVLMIAGGLTALRRPVRFRGLEWAALAGGNALILLSFTRDFRHFLASKPPGPYPWWLLLAGLSLAAVAIVSGRRRTGTLSFG